MEKRKPALLVAQQDRQRELALRPRFPETIIPQFA